MPTNKSPIKKMPQNSRQFIKELQENKTDFYLENLSEEQINQFFLRDIQIQRRILFWDRLNSLLMLTIVPYFAGLVYHDHATEKLVATRDLRDEDPRFITPEVVSGFVALSALTTTPSKQAEFEYLWNKACADTQNKVLTSICSTNHYEGLGFPNFNGLYGLFLYGQFDALQFIANNTSPWAISNAYGGDTKLNNHNGNSRLNNTLKRNVSLSEIQKTQIIAQYEDIVDFIKRPKWSVKNKPEAFSAFLTKHVDAMLLHLQKIQDMQQRESVFKANKDYKCLVLLLNQAILDFPLKDHDIKKQLSTLKERIELSLGQQNTALKRITQQAHLTKNSVNFSLIYQRNLKAFWRNDSSQDPNVGVILIMFAPVILPIFFINATIKSIIDYFSRKSLKPDTYTKTLASLYSMQDEQIIESCIAGITTAYTKTQSDSMFRTQSRSSYNLYQSLQSQQLATTPAAKKVMLMEKRQQLIQFFSAGRNDGKKMQLTIAEVLERNVADQPKCQV